MIVGGAVVAAEVVAAEREVVDSAVGIAWEDSAAVAAAVRVDSAAVEVAVRVDSAVAEVAVAVDSAAAVPVVSAAVDEVPTPVD